MKLFTALLVLLTSFVISGVAGYYSIVGMMALFAASALPVAIMMGSLEFAKLVASGWLKFNWSNRAVNFLHKTYLTAAVVVLMAITSIGIYGFLSAGHLEQQAPLSGLALQAEQLERQIAQREAENVRLEKRLNQIDAITDKTLDGDARRGLRASERQKRERIAIQAQIDENYQEINALNDKLVPLKQQTNTVEAKLGPIKYFAKFVGLEDESAVQIIIGMIMLVFDPLAVILMLSGLITFAEWREERLARKRDIETNAHQIPGGTVDVVATSDYVEDIGAPVDHSPPHDVLTETTPVLDGLLDAQPNPDWQPIDTDFFADTVQAPEPPEGSLLVELEAHLSREDRMKTARERLIAILEEEPTLLEEVVEVAEEVRAEQVKSTESDEANNAIIDWLPLDQDNEPK